MNKRGIAAFYYFMVGILFFLLGLALASPLTEIVNDDNVRGSDGLDCTNSSISNQDKAVCYQTDTMTPLYIGVIFGFAGIIILRLST